MSHQFECFYFLLVFISQSSASHIAADSTVGCGEGGRVRGREGEGEREEVGEGEEGKEGQEGMDEMEGELEVEDERERERGVGVEVGAEVSMGRRKRK